MRVLIACEFSGTVRDAFLAKGHEAMSCDLLPTESPGPHFQGDVRDVLELGWDLMIAFPPCTYLCGSGLHWLARGRIEDDGRPRLEHHRAALAFVRLLMGLPVPKIAIENPVGAISTKIRKPDQIIQPYDFGEDASKKTCLWLKGLPCLTHGRRFPGRLVEWPPGSGKTVERWSNQTDSGQNILGPSETRGKDRAVTYPGIARAMAEQWTL